MEAPTTPITLSKLIVISANNTILTTIRASESGAYEYFPKPFDIKQILSSLNKALLKKFSNSIANEQKFIRESLIEEVINPIIKKYKIIVKF